MPLKRVLIVEDSIEVGRFYQDAIRTAYPGVLITFTPSAEEAILESTRYNYELLVSDLRLPGMSGFDLARKIRVRQPDVRILVITGLPIDAAMRERGTALKVDLLLPKPVSASAFLEAVQALTGEAPRFSPAEAGPGGDVSQPKPSSRHHVGPIAETVQPEPAPKRKANPTRPLKPLPAAPSPKAEAQAQVPAQPSLATLLTDLRGSLGAQAAILLDDQGRVAAQAGDWPGPNLEAQLVPGLMAALSTLEKVNNQIKEGIPLAVHALRGQAYDLAFAPVGRYALLVFLRSSSGALRLALAFEHLLTVQAQLAIALQDMGLNIRPIPEATLPLTETRLEAPGLPGPLHPLVSPEAPAPELPEDPAALAQLAALLGIARPAPSQQTADDFWDNLVARPKPGAPNAPAPGDLSYEQARKLGLLPDETK